MTEVTEIPDSGRYGSRIEEHVEQMARMLCRQDMIHPDALMIIGEPLRTRCGYLVSPEGSVGGPTPAWQHYCGAARAALFLAERLLK